MRVAALPLFLRPLYQRRWGRVVLVGGCFTLTVVGLFLILFVVTLTLGSAPIA